MSDKYRIDMRCGSCGKLLAKTDGNTQIVCPRCGALNEYNPTTGSVRCEARKPKIRTSSSGVTFR